MITIIGCGTLGSRVVPRLTEFELTLIDHDTIHLDNLDRQEFEKEDVGKNKAEVLAGKHPNAKAHKTFLDWDNLDLLSGAEIIIDCTDNLVTRRLLNQFCLDNGIPLVHGAAAKDSGFVGIFLGKPCLECVYANKVAIADCKGGINPSVADLIAEKQVELTKTALTQEPTSSFFRVTDTYTKIPVTRSCAVCEGLERTTPETFTVSWCMQDKCLSTKPLGETAMEEKTFQYQDMKIHVLPTGEIRFHGTQDVDTIQEVAKQLYH